MKFLLTICTRDEAGRHFTERDCGWQELEEAGLINIDRPVHGPTGVAYDCQYWSLNITDAGYAALECAGEAS